jgi:uncharacterized damage-inducible protein DinB
MADRSIPERLDRPKTAPERETLDAFLDFHRATLLTKCSGLSDEQLRQRSVPPSSLSLLGLLRHMTDVERSWFRRTLAGDDVPPIYYTDANPDDDFDATDSIAVDEVYTAYAAEVETVRAITASYDLDATGRRMRNDGAVMIDFSLRWIYQHMIEEYARHNGHADLLRERIDGVTGE